MKPEPMLNLSIHQRYRELSSVAKLIACRKALKGRWCFAYFAENPIWEKLYKFCTPYTIIIVMNHFESS
jgi:hypothetical protein